LRDCEAVGFPLWQLDPHDGGRNAAELHGTIRLTEDVESGLLVLRDSLLNDVTIPSTVATDDLADGSPWGGLSGALVFRHGVALGVVIEHHPRQGRSAITILPVDRFAAASAGTDPDSAAVAEALGLPPTDELPLVDMWPLTDLVDVLVDGRLPDLAGLDPYTLGAVPSDYGNAVSYGQHDRYVPRTRDEALAAALEPGRLVALVGPSQAGKTRTAFEVVREHHNWGGSLLASPTPQSLNRLADHPALANSKPLVIWLDDLQRFLPPDGDLSQATISRILERPGPTVLLATLRTEQRALLRQPGAGLAREARIVLDNASTIELGSTRDDPDEQARSAAAYPQVSVRTQGLAEMLSGAPSLLRRYRDAATTNPLLHSLVQICIDWTRCGFARPIPEEDLLALAEEVLAENRPDVGLGAKRLKNALREARTATAGGGQVGLLAVRRAVQSVDAEEVEGRTHIIVRSTISVPGLKTPRSYEAFDYLLAADDGQGAGRSRPVADAMWWRFLDRATDDDALRIGIAAGRRGSLTVALAASRRAAQAGYTRAQNYLASLLADLDPPELAEARTWWTKAAMAGNLEAQFNLGLLLYDLNPPALAEARTWWTKAAMTGNTSAQNNLGELLRKLDPPEIAEARTWYTKAAEAGDIDAPNGLGALLYNLDPPEIGEARAWFKKAAEAGNITAQNNLGALLYNLDPPELAEARTWWTKAATAGNTEAQDNLGLLLSDLDPPELAEARAWWTKAAEVGNVSAQGHLGALLALLDPPELAEARTWLTKAATAGDTQAQSNLGLLLYNLDPPKLAKARTWLTKAATAGHTQAQQVLGALLYNLGPPELAEARAWWTKAAKAGDTQAQHNLGVLLSDLDPPKLAKARAWYTKAATAGHTGAQYNLGVLLSDLDPPELAEARTWYTKAATAGDTGAQYNLGALLYNLDPPELAEARTWLTKAAMAGHTRARDALARLEER
jgi:TPR repeat protein